jgi:hypothetical protein
LESSISDNPNPSEVSKLRLRQCLYSMHAIVCLGGSRPLLDSQLETLCQLLFLDDGVVSEDSQRITDLMDLWKEISTSFEPVDNSRERS